MANLISHFTRQLKLIELMLIRISVSITIIYTIIVELLTQCVRNASYLYYR